MSVQESHHAIRDVKPKKLPLVLVPALGSDDRLWQPVIDRLGASIECVVIRGVGNTIEAMAEDILAQAPAEFYLAGISMGGYVSLDVALQQTGRVKALALLNTSAAAAPSNRRANSLNLIESVTKGEFEQAVATISGSVAPLHPEVAALAAHMARDLGPEVFTDQQLAVMNRADRHNELTSLDMPVLTIVGDTDNITPQELGQKLAETISDGDLVVLDGVGHLSVLEDPDRVANALGEWLTHLETRSEAE